jgi:hypothetical protein
MRKLPLLLTAALLAAITLQPVYAEEWHGHDIHQFRGHDFDHWRAGNWFNGLHEGRNGWWWIVDGSWYFYPAPVYPYPDPYTPPVVAIAPAPGTAVIAAPSYLYYCKNPAGYYPYVPQCFGHWHRVIATTAQAPGTIIVQQQPGVSVVTQSAPPAVAQPPAMPQSAPPPQLAPAAGAEREADGKKLNTLAAEFANIDLSGRQAGGRLQALEKKVEIFRAALPQRNYNAVDMLKNTEDLQHRIAAAREKLGGPPPGEAPAPGTAVTFPPQ